MLKLLSEAKWLQLNLKIFIIFYCIVTIILKPILCQNENPSEFILKDDNENYEKNVNLNLLTIQKILFSTKSESLNSNSINVEDKKNDKNKIMDNLSPYLRTKRSETNGMLDNKQPTFTKIFNVLVKRNLDSNEFVGLTGDIYELGEWELDDAIKLHRSELITHLDGEEIWTGTVNIFEQNKSISSSDSSESDSAKRKRDISTTIKYRYFIGRNNSKNDKISIVEWENHVEPRKSIQPDIVDNIDDSNSKHYSSGVLDTFSEIHGQISKDSGWLQEHETIVQLKFFRNPFNIKTSHLDQYRLKIIPLDSNLNINDHPNSNLSDIIVKYSKLKYNDSNLKVQPLDGVIYNPDDMLIFHIHLIDDNLNKTKFLIHLYDDSNAGDNSYQLLGYQYIQGLDLTESQGEINLKIISQNTSDEIGRIKLLYLVIKPMEMPNLTFRTSFSNYWQTNWTALDVGHRGLGMSFKLPQTDKPPVIENTITSMKQAGNAGADMVEFDVHLTKDLIPVIYHDFTILVRDDTTKPPNKNNLIRIHLQDLTYDELKDTKMYYIELDGHITEYKSYNDETDLEYRLFPKLEDFFEHIDPSIGFDIEIKWPQLKIDGNFEANQTLDKNLFVDRILKTLLEKGAGRLSYLSTFDADLCTMLKFKQNMYPVMFLTMGTLHNWTPFYDPRTSSVENVIANANTWNLFGIVAHSKDYFNDPSLINLSFKLNQKIFCWGNDINSTSAVQQMKNIGMTGVIYDRIDRFLTPKKISVFKDDDLLEIFNKQHL